MTFDDSQQLILNGVSACLCRCVSTAVGVMSGTADNHIRLSVLLEKNIGPFFSECVLQLQLYKPAVEQTRWLSLKLSSSKCMFYFFLLRFS